MTDRATRDRLLAFERSLDRQVCDETAAMEWGTAYLTPSLPAVWHASSISLERTGIDPDEAAALADEALGGAGLRHRTVVPCDEEDGRRLAAAFEDRPGWEVERVQYMTWDPERRSSLDRDRRPKDERRLGTPAARETSLAEILPLREHLHRELTSPGAFPVGEVVAQLLELDRRFVAAAGDRWFVAPAEGEPASACVLFGGAGICQVEDVGTVASERGRGLAQSVVMATLAEAQSADPEVIYLAADADDWPRLMYEKLGFSGVGEVHVLLRRDT
jgi:hypothetical protein